MHVSKLMAQLLPSCDLVGKNAALKLTG